MQVVRLLKAYQSNNAGELCGFPEEKAALLIKRGYAKAEGAPAATTAKPEPEADAPERVDKMEHGEQKRPRRSRRAQADANDS